MSESSAEPAPPPVEADPEHEVSVDEVIAEASRALDRDRHRGSPPGEANTPGPSDAGESEQA